MWHSKSFEKSSSQTHSFSDSMSSHSERLSPHDQVPPFFSYIIVNFYFACLFPFSIFNTGRRILGSCSVSLGLCEFPG